MSGFDFKVGDVVVRRDGSEGIVAEFDKENDCPLRLKKGDGGGFLYHADGHWARRPTDQDIVSIKTKTPTKENPITLRGPEALIYFRDNKGARIMEVDGETVVNTDSLVDVMRLISTNYKCWIEPRYTTTDSQILDNGKELSRQEIADLLNKCDADG